MIKRVMAEGDADSNVGDSLYGVVCPMEQTVVVVLNIPIFVLKIGARFICDLRF